jgi:Domain of unknown function (DUF4365)
MLPVGKTDVFERKYMEKFRQFASEFGEFVTYERDRGARDIGLHLTHQLKSGQERMSSALCWFQMKGLMPETLSAEKFESQDEVSISLEVKHLKYWYLQPIPTYLVIYVGSVDKFLILNIQNYATERWGRGILLLDQKTATIQVPISSKLDEQAFKLILMKTDIQEWQKALGADGDRSSVRLCRRDYNLIWHLGSAKKRQVQHRLEFWDWQTKCRSQLYIQEKSLGKESKWMNLRDHWHHRMEVQDLETVYPYIEFFAIQNIKNERHSEVPPVFLSNQEVIYGINPGRFFEYFEYCFGMRLNEMGEEMFSWIQTLESAKLIEINPGESESISIASWHLRAV